MNTFDVVQTHMAYWSASTGIILRFLDVFCSWINESSFPSVHDRRICQTSYKLWQILGNRLASTWWTFLAERLSNFQRTYWVWSGGNLRTSCTSRNILQHEYLLANNRLPYSRERALQSLLQGLTSHNYISLISFPQIILIFSELVQLKSCWSARSKLQ